MMNLTLTGILNLIKQYGYVMIFPVAVVEGPIISVLSGFLASLGLFNVFVVYLILVLGDLVGDVLYYCIGRFGAGPFFKRWGHVFGVSEDRIVSFQDHFKKHEVYALLIGKTQPTGSIVLATAGFVKMKFDRFLFISFLGTLVKTAALVALGYYFGKSYVAIDAYITKVGIVLLLASVILVLAYIEHYRKKA